MVYLLNNIDTCRRMSIYEDLDKLLTDIQRGDRAIVDLNEDEVVELRKRANPYGQAVNIDGKYQNLEFAYSFINLKEEYMKKLLMTSMVGYMFKRACEWGVPENDYTSHPLDIDKDEVTTKFIEENLIDGKVVLREEEPENVGGGVDVNNVESFTNKFKRRVVYDFLMDAFSYDADKHVSSAYMENPDDPERRPIKRKTKKYGQMKATKGDSKRTKLKEVYKEVRQIIPPSELWSSFDKYYSVNYDALVKAVRDLYCEKKDLDVSLIIYTPFDEHKDYDDFVHKHESELTVQIRNCPQNKWVIQTDTRINRDRQDMYNSNTRIVQQILDTAAENQKVGKRIIQNKIDKQKKQNELEAGADPDIMKDYKKSKMKEHRKMGFREVSEFERKQEELTKRYQNRFDVPSAELDEEQYKDAIEVQTWVHDPKTKTMTPSSFYTKETKIDADKGAIINSQNK